jgi:aldehyde dehydrogenase (NAD+)
MSAVAGQFSATSGYPGLLAELRAAFSTGITRPLAWRRDQLSRLEVLIQENTAELSGALHKDLGKCSSESWLTDLGLALSSVRSAQKKLGSWMAPERVRNPIALVPARSFVIREPLGVVLIISPWNYPVQLTLMPLVAAIAAGNCVVVKPSEISSCTSQVLARLIPLYLDSKCVAVVEGAADVATALLAERFDHIFYTGNPAIGRIVMEAAARHLTPVTLELGGKSPCIVDESAHLETAARRIVFGKFLNAGQTCIAPDYILVHESREQKLLTNLKAAISEFYGSDPRSNSDYGRIVNDRHFMRLRGLVGSGQLVVGGEMDRQSRYIAPTILRNVDLHSPLMADEIFGPILPVIPIRSVSDAVEFVNARPKPLALYLFCQSRQVEHFVLQNTSSGGVCVNTTLLHHANERLPFGGVGESGMGNYHGRFGFETFSHKRALVRKPVRPEVPVAYPPYTKVKDFLLRWLL